MGDPAGIGPEVIVKAFHQAKLHEFCQPVVIGDAKTIEGMVKLLKLQLAVKAAQEIKRILSIIIQSMSLTLKILRRVR